MNVATVLLTGITFLAWGQIAQAEELSGTYLYSGSEFCQIKVSAPLGTVVHSATLKTAVLTATLGTVAYPGNKTGPAVVAVTQGPAVTGAVTGSAVTDFQTLSTNLVEEIGTAVFNSSTGRMSMNRISIAGDSLAVKEIKGENLQRRVVTDETRTFSSTATTLTLDGKVYDAVFGDVAGGIARHVNYLRLDKGPGCVFRGTLVRQ